MVNSRLLFKEIMITHLSYKSSFKQSIVVYNGYTQKDTARINRTIPNPIMCSRKSSPQLLIAYF